MSDGEQSVSEQRGPIAWMAQHAVAANLLMVMLVVGGLLVGSRLRREVFPQVPREEVRVTASYPGATPEQVAQAVVEPIEQAVRGLESTHQIRAVSSEGYAWVQVRFIEGVEAEDGLEEVERALSQVTTFPAQMERPQVRVPLDRSEAITVMIHGPEATLAGLRELSERVHGQLVAMPEISTVEINGLRSPEVRVELDPGRLESLGLTREQVASAIAAATDQVAGGSLRGDGGEVLVRVGRDRERGLEIARIPLMARPDGSVVRVEDVAEVVDGFVQSEHIAYYNGQRAVRLDVYRVGEERPLQIARRVKEYVERYRHTMPPGYELSVWDDETEEFGARIDLLGRNAAQGLALVLVVLGLFLSVRLSFWVTLGIPISFLGALVVMPALGVSINMISLFGFIIVLGIVVDDAIVVGEAIYQKREECDGHMEAAIEGAREVGPPVIFSVLTTVVAFVPLLFVPERVGAFFAEIPMIVIPILLLSLVEALLILPAHLAHGAPERPGRLRWAWQAGMRWCIERAVRPGVEMASRWRWATLGLSLGLLMVAIGAVRGGHLAYTFLPEIESNYALAGVDMPPGTAPEQTEEAMRRMVQAAHALEARHGPPGSMVRGIYSRVGRGFRVPEGQPDRGGHLSFVALKLVGPGQRPMTTEEFARAWRAEVGQLPGATRQIFDFAGGPLRGGGISLNLRHEDEQALARAAQRLRQELGALPGVHNIEGGQLGGKPQLIVELSERGEALGLGQLELGRQVRAAFFGAEITRQIRGRDEVRVQVKRPLVERRSIAQLERMPVRLPGSGATVPLSEVARIRLERGADQITRIDGRRVLRVEADLDREVTSAGAVLEVVDAEILPELRAEVPGLAHGEGGSQRAQRRVEAYLLRATVVALLAMYALMAVAFGSYVQPLIIMGAIPFGVIGAFAGHMLLGFDLSMVSILGVVALSGVVVNDALVLIVAINGLRQEGAAAPEAVVRGVERRFRPILLTTLTTFFGLLPMMFETSVQARFLVPMAISLGCGILFVTFIVLALVPALYLIVEDLRGAWAWYRRL